MAPFRMPFSRNKQNVNGIVVDENAPPLYGDHAPTKSPMQVAESRRPSAMNIKQPKEPEEFKMGVVNDSGVYLPPSPPEKKSMWRHTPTSTTASSHRSVFSTDDSNFSISRESFESYRRSFDISARSPVIHPDASHSRQSLDGARAPLTPRSARQTSNKSFELPRAGQVKTVQEEDQDVFEDVGLDDGNKPSRKGIFSRFINNENSSGDVPRPGSGHGRFHLPGRKRGQSGQGAELGDIPRPASSKGANVRKEDDDQRQQQQQQAATNTK